MSIACDFCGNLADRHDDTLFIEAPSGLSHICEGCVRTCAYELSRKLLTRRKERANTGPCEPQP